MFDRVEFICPRCMEKNQISDDALLHDREITFACANCRKVVAVQNGVPDAIDNHFRSLRSEIGSRME